MVSKPLRCRTGFTLAELLVVILLFSLVGVVIFQILQQISRVWKYSQSHAQIYGDARAAFETIVTTLQQATLNSYWGYDSITAPSRYLAQSDLHFTTGSASTLLGLPATTYPAMAAFFQAPLGEQATEANPALNNLLNGIGFYIKWGNGQENVPAIIKDLNLAGAARYRYRLMEAIIPTEQNTIYQQNSSGAPLLGLATAQSGVDSWFATPVSQNQNTAVIAHPLAENVLALVFLCEVSHPSTSLDPQKSYDSRLYQYTAAASPPPPNPGDDVTVYTRNCLPQIVQVTMVVADEDTYNQAYGNNAATDLYAGPLFQNAVNYQADLATLGRRLTQKRILYQVFSTKVSLREGLWTSDYSY